MTDFLAPAPLKIVVCGLTLSSSWGNGHATTYRALLKSLAARGHEILYLERDLPWYAEHRDLPAPDFCRLEFYAHPSEIARFHGDIVLADIVMIGSYVPDAIELAKAIRPLANKLAFYDIDTPVTLKDLITDSSAYMSREVIDSYDLYLSFTAGPILRLLEDHYNARRARALLCAVDPLLYKPHEHPAPARWALGYLGTYSADRQPALDRLLIAAARKRPDLRFVVAGAQYPRDCAWPENVDRIEHLPPADHADFYNSVGWALNITRADMIAAGFSPSVRLFEAAACGTPIISDVWPGLGTIFHVGTEIVTAANTEAVLDILDLPEATRYAIGQAGRRRVMSEHTADLRARLLETYIAEISGRSSDKARSSGKSESPAASI